MEEFDHRRGIYPLALSVALANWRILLFAAVIMSVNRFIAVGAERELGEESPYLFAVWALEMLLDFSAIVMLDFTVVPCLLSLGALRGWKALSRASISSIGLYVGAAMLFGLILLVPVTLIGIFALGFVSPEEDATAYGVVISIAVIAMLVLLTARLGLIFPDIVASGQMSFGRASGWGREHFRRLNYLLWTGMAPITLIVFYLDGSFSVADISESAPAVAGPSSGDFVHAALVGVVGVAASVLTTTALCKVYYVVAPPDEQLQNERIAEVFD